MTWLRDIEQLSLPALAEAARGSTLESLVNELMTDLLDKDDSWDWNAEFDGALKQLRDDWRRRRQQELATRPLNSLSASERRGTDDTGTLLACHKRQDNAPDCGIIAGF